MNDKDFFEIQKELINAQDKQEELCGQEIDDFGFGEVLAQRKEKKDALRQRLYRYYLKDKEIDELFKMSDIISIHSPLNEKTENLVNMEKLALMKKSAVIINVGRGAIVNSRDLVEAVDTGLIRGAGIDVYPTEPPGEDDPFMKIKHPERFVLTPHIAWASVTARQRCVDVVAENIVALCEKRGCNDVW